MKFGVRHQETYSRGQLLLRTLFGAIYIALPHMFVLVFLMIAAAFLNFITFWAILFTGKFPRGFFNYQIKLHRWQLRVGARLNNLADGYPAFGLNAIDDHVQLEVEYPESSSRLLALARVLFGAIYVLIPHAICLLFLAIAASFVRIIIFWVVLITGKLPAGLFNFMVGVMRWQFRVNAYMGYLTDKYPPFSLSGDEADFNVSPVSSSDLLDD